MDMALHIAARQHCPSQQTDQNHCALRNDDKKTSPRPTSELVAYSSGKKRESVYRAVSSNPERRRSNLRNLGPLAIASLHGGNYGDSPSKVGLPLGPERRASRLPKWNRSLRASR